MQNFEQLELNLFPEPDFNEIIESENINGLSVTYANRLKKNWQIEFKDTSRNLIVPEYFKKAPYKVKKNLIKWALHVKSDNKKQKNDYYKQKKDYEKIVHKYMGDGGVSYQQKRLDNPQKYFSNTSGTVYNLSEIFDYLNNKYFNHSLTSYLRWGTYCSQKSFQSWHTDIYETPFSLITIAGVYNYASVPEYAIQGALYHEMLHIKYPPAIKNGRTLHHCDQFRAAEKKYTHLQQWIDWKKNQITGIVKSLKRRQKKRR